MRSLKRGLAAAIVLSLCAATAGAQVTPDTGWPASEGLMSQYRSGNYAAVIAGAPATLNAEPWNNELRLAYAYSLIWSGREWDSTDEFMKLIGTEVEVDARLGLANSYAWTGRMSESLPHYRALLNTKHRGEAKQGMANALLWMRREDLALTLFRELRAEYPDQDVGKEGLYYALRATRARTTLGYTYTHDNQPMTRREPSVTHAWRMFDNSVILGVGYSPSKDSFDNSPGLSLERKELTLRAEAVAIPLAPRVIYTRVNEIDTDNAGTLFALNPVPARNFGELRLTLTDWPLYVNVGRVDWGKQQFTGAAQVHGLVADRYGVEGTYQVAWGEVRGFANRFKVSQGDVPAPLEYAADNTLDNADLRLYTRWRPWGKEIKPFVGAHYRNADHTDPFYWSPRNYVLGYAGLEFAWEDKYYTVAGILQGGWKLAGDASSAWLAAFSAKRWLNDDWAVGMTAYAQGGTKTANYRAHGAGITVEKLW
jgi:tetratricopeptide (TPR) repeat protein